MVDLIASDNKKLLQTYKQWHQNFLTMLKLGEITTQRMINLYIKFLPSEKGLVVDSAEFFPGYQKILTSRLFLIIPVKTRMESISYWLLRWLDGLVPDRSMLINCLII